MESRMRNPVVIEPQAMQALHAIGTSLLLSIARINVWNRLNVATRQVAGEWVTSVGQWTA